MGFSGKPDILQLFTIEVKMTMWTIIIKFDTKIFFLKRVVFRITFQLLTFKFVNLGKGLSINDMGLKAQSSKNE